MNKSTKCQKYSIGGQALIEGVMMRGPQKTAMAVRHTSGEIVTEEWQNDNSEKPRFYKLPFVRGIFNMIDSLKVGYKCLMRSAELAGLEEEDPTEQNNSKAMTALLIVSSVLGIGLAVLLFMYLPSFLYAQIAKLFDAIGNTSYWVNHAVWRGVFEGILRLIIFLAYLTAVSLMSDIRRVFMYHGAEHKTIFCYENGEELTVENVRKQSRFHPRCGTSFLVLTLLIGMVISIFVRVDIVWLRVLVKIALLPITVGIGYEAIKLAGRKSNWFTRMISAPGLWIQRLTTREPEDGMIECAIRSFTAVLPTEEPEMKESDV